MRSRHFTQLCQLHFQGFCSEPYIGARASIPPSFCNPRALLVGRSAFQASGGLPKGLGGPFPASCQAQLPALPPAGPGAGAAAKLPAALPAGGRGSGAQPGGDGMPDLLPEGGAGQRSDAEGVSAQLLQVRRLAGGRAGPRLKPCSEPPSPSAETACASWSTATRTPRCPVPFGTIPTPAPATSKTGRSGR